MIKAIGLPASLAHLLAVPVRSPEWTLHHAHGGSVPFNPPYGKDIVGHPRFSRGSSSLFSWIPAFAGMTKRDVFFSLTFGELEVMVRSKEVNPLRIYSKQSQQV